ncbi:ATP-utilizing chromatin assembly and remodelling protein [Pycnococcus provasolii]
MPQTSEVFTSYSSYLKAAKLYATPIWCCRFTGKSGLTYDEALEAEAESTAYLAQFPPYFAAPAACIIQHSKHALSDLLKHILAVYADRYVPGERLQVCLDTTEEQQCVVAREVFDHDQTQPGDAGYRAYLKNEDVSHDARRYVVRLWATGAEHTVTASQLRRPKKARGKDAAPSVPPPNHVLKRWLLEHFDRHNVAVEGTNGGQRVEVWAANNPSVLGTFECPPWVTAEIPSWRVDDINAPTSPVQLPQKRKSAAPAAEKPKKQRGAGAGRKGAAAGADPMDTSEDAVVAAAAAAVAAAADAQKNKTSSRPVAANMRLVYEKVEVVPIEEDEEKATDGSLKWMLIRILKEAGPGGMLVSDIQGKVAEIEEKAGTTEDKVHTRAAISSCLINGDGFVRVGHARFAMRAFDVAKAPGQLTAKVEREVIENKMEVFLKHVDGRVQGKMLLTPTGLKEASGKALKQMQEAPAPPPPGADGGEGASTAPVAPMQAAAAAAAAARRTKEQAAVETQLRNVRDAEEALAAAKARAVDERTNQERLIENAINCIGGSSGGTKAGGARHTNKETCAVSKRKPKFLKSPLVLCDKCPKAYMLDSLLDRYPGGYDALPDGRWVCPSCTEKGAEIGSKFDDEITKREDHLKVQRQLLETKLKNLKEKQESLVEKEKEKLLAREKREKELAEAKERKEKERLAKEMASRYPIDDEERYAERVKEAAEAGQPTPQRREPPNNLIPLSPGVSAMATDALAVAAFVRHFPTSAVGVVDAPSSVSRVDPAQGAYACGLLTPHSLLSSLLDVEESEDEQKAVGSIPKEAVLHDAVHAAGLFMPRNAQQALSGMDQKPGTPGLLTESDVLVEDYGSAHALFLGLLLSSVRYEGVIENLSGYPSRRARYERVLCGALGEAAWPEVLRRVLVSAAAPLLPSPAAMARWRRHCEELGGDGSAALPPELKSIAPRDAADALELASMLTRAVPWYLTPVNLQLSVLRMLCDCAAASDLVHYTVDAKVEKADEVRMQRKEAENETKRAERAKAESSKDETRRLKALELRRRKLEVELADATEAGADEASIEELRARLEETQEEEEAILGKQSDREQSAEAAEKKRTAAEAKEKAKEVERERLRKEFETEPSWDLPEHLLEFTGNDASRTALMAFRKARADMQEQLAKKKLDWHKRKQAFLRDEAARESAERHKFGIRDGETKEEAKLRKEKEKEVEADAARAAQDDMLRVRNGYLGMDASGRRVYWFEALDPMKLYIESPSDDWEEHFLEGELSMTYPSSSTWGVLASIADVSSYAASLDEKGVREAQLKARIMRCLPRMDRAFNAMQVWAGTGASRNATELGSRSVGLAVKRGKSEQGSTSTAALPKSLEPKLDASGLLRPVSIATVTGANVYARGFAEIQTEDKTTDAAFIASQIAELVYIAESRGAACPPSETSGAWKLWIRSMNTDASEDVSRLKQYLYELDDSMVALDVNFTALVEAKEAKERAAEKKSRRKLLDDDQEEDDDDDDEEDDTEDNDEEEEDDGDGTRERRMSLLGEDRMRVIGDDLSESDDDLADTEQSRMTWRRQYKVEAAAAKAMLDKRRLWRTLRERRVWKDDVAMACEERSVPHVAYVSAVLGDRALVFLGSLQAKSSKAASKASAEAAAPARGRGRGRR